MVPPEVIETPGSDLEDRAALPARWDIQCEIAMVGQAGIEPASLSGSQILNLGRLPVAPLSDADLVGKAGVEPACHRWHEFLKLACIPIPPLAVILVPALGLEPRSSCF